MKRTLIMDLFHGNKTREIGEWNNIKNLPNEHCKVKLKLKDNTECFAYYYSDIPKAHFWHIPTQEYILDNDIISWKHLEEV
jgi:hypothetical protein